MSYAARAKQRAPARHQLEEFMDADDMTAMMNPTDPQETDLAERSSNPPSPPGPLPPPPPPPAVEGTSKAREGEDNAGKEEQPGNNRNNLWKTPLWAWIRRHS